MTGTADLPTGRPPLTPAQRNALLESVMFYIMKLAFKKTRRSSVGMYDLVQETALQILQNADRYDRTRGAPTTWATLQFKSTLATDRSPVV